jgi:hypothetical protein
VRQTGDVIGFYKKNRKTRPITARHRQKVTPLRNRISLSHGVRNEKKIVERLEDDAREMLKNAGTITNVDTLLNWAGKFTGLLRDFSPYNALNIQIQDPRFTIVRSQREWERFGYEVKDNAKPIFILVPVGAGVKHQPGEIASFIEKKREEGLSDEAIESLYREKFRDSYVPTHNFTTGRVYDKRDVKPIKGKKQLEPFDPDDASNEEIYSRIRNFAVKNFVVEERGIKNARGLSHGGKITIMKVPGESKQAINTLVHEIAHEVLGHHNRNLKGGLEEAEAELTAYLVGRYYHVDLGGEARPYVGSWLKGSKKGFGEENLDRVLKAAHKIINGTEKANGGEP